MANDIVMMGTEEDAKTMNHFDVGLDAISSFVSGVLGYKPLAEVHGLCICGVKRIVTGYELVYVDGALGYDAIRFHLGDVIDDEQ